MLRDVSMWENWTFNRICVFDINAHNSQDCTRIKSALLFSAAGLAQDDLAIRPRWHASTLNNEKYLDRRSNFAATGMKIMNEL